MELGFSVFMNIVFAIDIYDGRATVSRVMYGSSVVMALMAQYVRKRECTRHYRDIRSRVMGFNGAIC